jgi:hypothetical protein
MLALLRRRLLRRGQTAAWHGHLPVIAGPEMESLKVTPSHRERQREN